MKNLRTGSLLSAAAIALLAAGCQGPQRGAPGSEAAIPQYELHGSRMIACCCGAPCPCRLNEKPMQNHGCDHVDAVHVDRGSIGKTSMDGLTWVFVGRGFGEKAEGNWVVVYLSDQATGEQAAALQGMLESDVKGMGGKAKHLAGDFKGIRRAPISYTVSSDRREFSVAITGILDLKTRAHINPGHKEPVVSTGIMDAFGDRFIHTDTLVHRYEDKDLKYAWDLTGRQSNWADFILTPARVAQGSIGWGCWTAHSEFKDQGKYQEEMIREDESVKKS